MRSAKTPAKRAMNVRMREFAHSRTRTSHIEEEATGVEGPDPNASDELHSEI